MGRAGMNDREELYWTLENEGFYYYFSQGGPKPAHEVPEDIRELWTEASDLSKRLSVVEDIIMTKLEPED
jgi:hypothetical protein